MESIFPSTEIKTRFEKPLTIRHLGISEFNEILKQQDGLLFGLALNVWNRVVNSSSPPADPLVLSPIITRHFQGERVSGQMLRRMEMIFGAKVIRDISYTHCKLNDASVEEKTVGKLILAHVHPNDLHIADINFQNPYKPIPKAKRKRHYQHYAGLGLLGTVMERIDSLASELGVDSVTLTAAHDDLVPRFSQYGYSVETNKLGKAANAMEKPVLQLAGV